MSITTKWFGNGVLHLMNGDVNWKALNGSIIKVALMKPTFVPNQDTQATWSDVSAEEVRGTNYQYGGKRMTLLDPTYDIITHKVKLDAQDVSWTNLDTFTTRYAVVYNDSGISNSSYLLGYIDFGFDEECLNGSFSIKWSSDGILVFTAL